MANSLEAHTPTGPVVKVAFYCRVAPDNEDGSLQRQLDRLASLVEDRRRQGENWHVSKKLVEGEKDGKSAYNVHRPAYQKLLELVRARLIDVIAVTRLDRLSRNPSDFVKLIEQLERHGVNLVSVEEQIDLMSRAGRLQTLLLRGRGR